MKIGLGFLFGAKDSGAIKTVSSLNVKLQETSLLFKALTINSLNNIADGIDKLGDSTGSLTTSLQQQQMDFDKSFAKGGARIGIYGSQLDSLKAQAFSTAYALNAPAEAVGDLKLEMANRKITPQDLGVDSFADAVKAMEVLGFEGTSLVMQIDSMKRSYGFTTEAAGEFTNSFVRQATGMGLGSAAINGLGGTLDALDAIWSQTAFSEGASEVNAATSQIALLAGALKESVGADATKAWSSATGLFTKLQEGALNYEQALAGVADWDVSQLGLPAVDLAGGFPALIEMIQKGDVVGFSEKMAQSMAHMTEQGNTAGIGRLNKFITDMGGAELAFAITQGKDFSGVLGRLGKDAEKSGLDMKKAGDQYRTALSLDDQIERTKTAFKTRLFNIITKDTHLFVKDMKSRYADWGKSMEILTGKVAVKSGAKLTWLQSRAKELADAGYGPIAEKLLAITMIGPAAIQPLFDLASTLFPIIAIAKMLGFNFGFISSAASAALAPVKAVGGALWDIGDVAATQISGAAKVLGGPLLGAAKKLGSGKMLSGFIRDAKYLGGEVLPAVASSVGEFALAGAKKLPLVGRAIGPLGSMLGKFGGMAVTVFGGLLSVLTPVLGVFGSMALAALSLAGPFLVIGAAIAGVAVVAALVGGALTDGFEGPLKKVESMLGLTEGTLSGFSKTIKKIGQQVWGFFFYGLINVDKWLTKFVSDLDSWDADKITATIMGWFGGGGGLGGAVLSELAGMAWGVMVKLGAVLMKLAPIVMKVLWNLGVNLMTFLGKALMEYGPPAIQMLWEGLAAAFNWLAGAVVEYGPTILEGLFDGLVAGVTWLLGAIIPFGSAIMKGMGAALLASAGLLWAIGKTAFTWVWGKVAELFTALTSGAGPSWMSQVGGVLYNAFTGAWSYVKGALGWLWDQAALYLPEVFGGISALLGGLLGTGLGDAMLSAFEGVKSVILGIIDGIVSMASGLWDMLSGAVTKVVGVASGIWGAMFGSSSGSTQTASNADVAKVRGSAQADLDVGVGSDMVMVLGKLEAAFNLQLGVMRQGNIYLKQISENTMYGLLLPKPASKES
ncbi:hypothetical protein UFOVP1382_151 [uncultured Caudovirales phage]|uniref:Uncharacterized protein n=1 Tax=uncultured Caudovirales phage TaxID=2100421 RepID=A0A6J5S599_9CAUD|nr:hypothetical protein UFOVP1382_151 [uncultured Caudovirales phage]